MNSTALVIIPFVSRPVASAAIGLCAACCIVLLAAPTADARDNRPGLEKGSVSCKCHCEVNRGDIAEIESRYVGGVGEWRGTRAQCKDFSNSACQMHMEDDRIATGKLRNCDTIVHRLPPGRPPSLETAPTTGKAAPAPSSSGVGTSKTLNLPRKLPRKAD